MMSLYVHDSAAASQPCLSGRITADKRKIKDFPKLPPARAVGTADRCCMNNTKKAFRIVVTREKISQQTGMFGMGYRYHAMATNVDEWSGPEVIEWYSRRGNAENLIKETKIGFGLEYLPFSSFRGNVVWFATGLLSYNVAVAMKNLVLPEVYRDKEIKTIRYWIYSIPAWIVEHGRKVYWALSCDKRQFKEIKRIRNRCLASGFG